MRQPQSPTGFLSMIDDLSEAPQLITLATLDAALNFVKDALCAAHPELYDDSRAPTPEERQREPIEVWLADIAITQATQLRDTLARYRHALNLPPPNDDIDF